MEKVQTVTGEDIQEQIRRENKVAAAWLIHYRERKRIHEERRREIESGTKKERDENVGGGRSSEPGRPTEAMALALDAHDNCNNAKWLLVIELVKAILGPKKRKLLELRQECRYYISPDGGRPGWIAPVQQRFGEMTGWCPAERTVQVQWAEIVALTVRVAVNIKADFKK